MLILDSHTRNKCQTEVNLGGGKKKRGMRSREQERGDKDGLTICAQRTHFTHTSSKPMKFALVAVERGRGEKGDFDLIWQPETPSHCLYQKGREAWSVHCHKINTDTKGRETEIKRVIDVEREKVKAGRAKSE